MALIGKTLSVRLWSLFKVPLLFLTGPTVHVLSEKKAEISIGLWFLTRNHFNSMYLGALVAGADVASGLLAMEVGKRRTQKVLPLFKDLEATFHKRALGRTFFVCEEGGRIQEAVDQAILTGERQNITVSVRAFCPSLSKETVADFKMTLSLKKAQA